MPYTIAIDGPAGAGKTTVSKMVAEMLGFQYVDTGALYRMLALKYKRQLDTRKVGVNLDFLMYTTIQISDGVYLLDGEPVGKEIRTEKISQLASELSTYPSARKFLFDTQRNIIEKTNCVMEGRDIGTVIAPNAFLKIYLDADIHTRAARRAAEKSPCIYNDVLREMKIRDKRDMTRVIAPLKKASDAIYLDNSNITLEQTAEIIVALAEKRKHEKR